MEHRRHSSEVKTKAIRLQGCQAGLASDAFEPQAIGCCVSHAIVAQRLTLSIEPLHAITFSRCKVMLPVAPSDALLASQAPEVLMHSAQGSAVDWWALGVLAYEMLLGRMPFAGGNTRATYLAIMNDEPCFPPPASRGKTDGEESGNPPPQVPAVSTVCRDFVRALLAKDPSARAGSRGAHEVKSHQFLTGMEWHRLLELEPPFAPERMAASSVRTPTVRNTLGWRWSAEEAAAAEEELRASGKCRDGKGRCDAADGDAVVANEFDWLDGGADEEEHAEPFRHGEAITSIAVESDAPAITLRQFSEAIPVARATTADCVGRSSGIFPDHGQCPVAEGQRAPVF